MELGKESNYTVKPIKAFSKEDLTLRKLTIFNMSGLSPAKRGSLFTDCMSILYEERLRKQLPPFFLIVEEAGNLINNPEAAALLQKIASEGLKYGISMCLLCQHPTEVDDKILSQMGIQIMGRTVDPGDLKCLKYMAQKDVYSLSRFRVGEWLINGVPLLYPTKIRVRERYSKKP
jgi:DNA helicase HerA-like ATPase